MEGHILGKGHGQIEPEGQIAVALLEPVDLFLSFAAALGKQNLGILNGGGVQRGKAVGRIGIAEDLHHLLKLDLLGRQQLHKTGQSPGLNDIHKMLPHNYLNAKFKMQN